MIRILPWKDKKIGFERDKNRRKIKDYFPSSTPSNFCIILLIGFPRACYDWNLGA